MHEQFPATDTEALAPRSQDKQIPAAWLERCYREQVPLVEPVGAPFIPGLVLYSLPRFAVEYVMGGDPAEGNVNSDDSSFHVLEKVSGEEVARYAGKLTPSVFAARMKAVSDFYNRAKILVERNNHGHAVILWFTENGFSDRLLTGPDNAHGWLSHTLGKTTLYDAATESFRVGAYEATHPLDVYAAREHRGCDPTSA